MRVSAAYLLSVHFVTFAKEVVFDILDDIADEERRDFALNEVNVLRGMLHEISLTEMKQCLNSSRLDTLSITNICMRVFFLSKLILLKTFLNIFMKFRLKILKLTFYLVFHLTANTLNSFNFIWLYTTELCAIAPTCPIAPAFGKIVLCLFEAVRSTTLVLLSRSLNVYLLERIFSHTLRGLGF